MKEIRIYCVQFAVPLSCTSINLLKCHTFSVICIAYVTEHEVLVDTGECVKCTIKPFTHWFLQQGARDAGWTQYSPSFGWRGGEDLGELTGLLTGIVNSWHSLYPGTPHPSCKSLSLTVLLGYWARASLRFLVHPGQEESLGLGIGIQSVAEFKVLRNSLVKSKEYFCLASHLCFLMGTWKRKLYEWSSMRRSLGTELSTR